MTNIKDLLFITVYYCKHRLLHQKPTLSLLRQTAEAELLNRVLRFWFSGVSLLMHKGRTKRRGKYLSRLLYTSGKKKTDIILLAHYNCIIVTSQMHMKMRNAHNNEDN